MLEEQLTLETLSITPDSLYSKVTKTNHHYSLEQGWSPNLKDTINIRSVFRYDNLLSLSDDEFIFCTSLQVTINKTIYSFYLKTRTSKSYGDPRGLSLHNLVDSLSNNEIRLGFEFMKHVATKVIVKIEDISHM